MSDPELHCENNIIYKQIFLVEHFFYMLFQ
jgi:hypothetical protein